MRRLVQIRDEVAQHLHRVLVAPVHVIGEVDFDGVLVERLVQLVVEVLDLRDQTEIVRLALLIRQPGKIVSKCKS